MAKPTASSRGRWTKALISSVLHPATFFLTAAAVISVSACWGWAHWRHTVIPHERWALNSRAIELNLAPPWYGERLRGKLSERIAASGSALTDVDLLPQMVELLEAQPFIAAIESATKTYWGLQFQVRYRLPVAWIGQSGARQRLVDQFGVVVVPDEFPAAWETELPQILLPQLSADVGRNWDVWPDQRVLEAAVVCRDLGGQFKAWGVNRLVSYWRHPELRAADAPWELWTPAGGRIIWGDTLVVDSIDARLKVAAINEWISANGSIDSLTTGYVLDVRQGVAQVIPQLRAAQASPNGDAATFK